MPVARGKARDRAYRRAIESQGLAGVFGATQSVLTSPGPPDGKQSYPALNDRWAVGGLQWRHVSLRSQGVAGVIGSDPNTLVVAGVAPTGAPALPAYIPRQKKVQMGSWQDEATFLNLLTAVAGAPFVPVDWTNPVRALQRFLNRTHLNIGTGYIGQDVIYGAPGEAPTYDYPNPIPKPPHRSNRTHLNTGTGYIGQDIIYGDPGQAPAYDYPNPIPKRPHRSNRGHLYVGTGLIGQDQIYGDPGQVPAYDWPNPTRRVRRADQSDPQQPSSWLNNLYTIIVAVAPFAQLDWPNPLRRVFSRMLTELPQPNLPSFLVTGLAPVGKILFLDRFLRRLRPVYRWMDQPGGSTAPSLAAVVPTATRSVTIDSNPSDALGIDSNPSDAATIDSNPSDDLGVSI